MANQNPTKAVSFRLPEDVMEELRKQPQHTKWVQILVLKNLGKCPVCGNNVKKEKEKTK